MVPWSILADPRAVLGIVISLIILSLPIIPITVQETYYTQETFTYEKTSDLTLMNKTKACFPQIICSVTEAHQSIKNTDTISGEFYLNFVFDNGIEKKTNTESITLLPGEEKDVSTEVPLTGQFDVELNIIPPEKTVPHVRDVDKNVNAWFFLSSNIFK